SSPPREDRRHGAARDRVDDRRARRGDARRRRGAAVRVRGQAARRDPRAPPRARRGDRAGRVKVSLRPVVAEDLEAFYEQQADPESVRLAAVPARDRAAHFPHWEKALADESSLVRTIDVDGENAGHIVSFLRDGVGEREVGYWLARSHWGRGVATEALTQF